MTTATESRVEAARGALNQHLAAFARINDAMRAIEAGTAPAKAAITQADTLRAERRGLIARLLRLGPVAGNEAPVVELTRAIGKAEPLADAAVAVLEARDAELAALQSEAEALHPMTGPLQVALLEAQFGVAADEIRGEVQALNAAFTAFVGRLASVVGAGVAHQRMAATLHRRHSVNTQPLGSAFPAAQIKVPAPGFGLPDNWLAADIGDAIAQAAAEAQVRWTR